jgi:uncharacterized phiE125 gp8 family phage protein
MSCVIRTNASCITPATVLPFDVGYARLHIRALNDVEDVLIEAWIRAAVQYFEEQTGRPIMRATWEYWLDAFPIETMIELPHPPLQSVVSVSYIASDGTLTSFGDGASPETVSWQAGYPEGVYARRGWIEPIYGASWPTTARTETGAVRIRYIAGYAETAAQVPELIKAALLLIVAQFDQFRSELHVSEGSRLERLPFGIDQMIDGFKKSSLSSQVLHRP